MKAAVLDTFHQPLAIREVVAPVSRGALDPDIGELVPIGDINTAYTHLREGRFMTRTVLTPPFNP